MTIEEAIEQERTELLQKAGDRGGEGDILASIAACDRLLVRVRQRRDLPPQPLGSAQRKAAVAIIKILDRLPPQEEEVRT